MRLFTIKMMCRRVSLPRVQTVFVFIIAEEIKTDKNKLLLTFRSRIEDIGEYKPRFLKTRDIGPSAEMFGAEVKRTTTL